MLINGYHRSDSVGMFVYGVRIDKLVLLQKKKKKKRKIMKVRLLGFSDSFGYYPAASL